MLSVIAVLQGAEPSSTPAGNRQFLVVASSYWSKTYKTFTFDIFDLDAGGKRVKRVGPTQVGEIRGLACDPVAGRLYLAGHEGLLCYTWPDGQQVWRRPVEGPIGEQLDSIALTRDGARLYSIHHFGFKGARGMSVFEAASGERLRIILNDTLRGGRFSQISHDGTRLYTSGGRQQFIIDPTTETLIASFKPVEEPVRFMLTPDGRRFVYATGPKRSVAIHDADGKLQHEIAVPDWEGMPTTGPKDRACLMWLALAPDGRQAWACDVDHGALHRFDLAADPPVYAGRADLPGKGKAGEGLLYSADGRLLVTGSGAILDAADGHPVGQLTDEQGRPAAGSNNLLALETDAAGTRILRTNQQGAPAWSTDPKSHAPQGE
jgi:hypothetical protein